MAKSRTKKPMRYGAPTCATFSGQCGAREQVDGEKRAPWVGDGKLTRLDARTGGPRNLPPCGPGARGFFQAARRGRADEGSCT
jgi:hypothetical protein